MNGPDSSSGRDRFEELVESFVARYRGGEHPSITEYAGRHPQLAQRIVRLFPTVAAIEQAVSADSLSAGGRVRTSEMATPDQIGDYRIIGELGRGGMGIVYEAEQQSLGRRVALKVLLAPGLSDGGRRERFLREARAAARLHHTNIVPVYGIGEEQGICYYVMQLISGRGLDEVLRDLRRQQRDTPDKPLDASDSSLLRAAGSDGSSQLTTMSYWNRATRIALQAAEALCYAHRQGLIHRDIKPSNLLLDWLGNIWVTDFGLAKADDDGNLTQSGDILGTLRYMAPEQLLGQADERTDVYGLGLTLYELVTLQPAFTAADRGMLVHQVGHQQPVRPRRLNQDIPQDLETVILKCIAKEPSDRYGRAADLVADLRCLLENRPIQARRAPARERLWRWCRRNPVVASLAACIALLLCVLAAVGTTTAWKLSRQNEAIRNSLHRTQAAERAALRHAEKAVQAEAAQRRMHMTTNRQLLESYLAQARALCTTRRPGQRAQALAAVQGARDVAEEIAASDHDRQRLRDTAAAALSQFDLTVKELWPDVLAPTSQNRVAFSYDGALYARAEPGHVVVVRRMADNGLVHEIPLLGALTDDRPRPYFSADGQFVIARGAAIDGSDHVVCVWRLRDVSVGAPCARIEVGGSRFDQALDIAPDSRSLVCLGPDGQVQMRALADGTPLAAWPRSARPDGLRLSADGRQLLIWSGSAVDILDVRTGRIARQIELPSRLDCAAWRSDGCVIACGGENGHVFLVNAVTGDVEQQCSGHQSEVRELAFHPLIDLLASSSWDGTVRLWDLRSGKEVLRTFGALGTFSRCGRWLGFVENQQVGRWEVSFAPWSMTLREGDQTVRFVGFCRKGDFAFAGGQHQVGVWDTRVGRRVLSIPDVTMALEHPTWDAWVTAGAAGIQVWPIQRNEGTLAVGSPQLMADIPCESVRVDPAGHIWVATQGDDVIVWDGQPSACTPERWRRDRLRFVDLSADGQWIAASGWNSPDIVIGTAGQSDPVTTLVAPRGGWIAFRRDSSLLAVSLLDRYELYETGTWTQVLSFPSRAPQFGALAWSPDNRSLAFVPEPGKLTIIDIDTRRPQLTIELQEGERIAALAFAPDGTRLAAGVRGGEVHVWDLEQLSADLSSLGLIDVPLVRKTAESDTGSLIESVAPLEQTVGRLRFQPRP